jgi:tetratricopeptide (TPR) repeat protein
MEMEKSFLISILFGLVLLSCSPLSSGTQVLLGNYAFQRGEYQSAALNYMEVLDNPEFRAFAAYNLGNVYQALGEPESAKQQWETIDLEEAPTELRFRLNFNLGVLLFQQGQYLGAYRAFRQAIKVKPSDLDTKKNLELSLLKLQTPSGDGQEAREALGQGSDLGETRVLLEYVEHKERELWKGQREETSETYNRDW